MAEWSNAPDSKSGIRLYRIVGSNPTPSARFKVNGNQLPVTIPIEAPHSDRAAGLYFGAAFFYNGPFRPALMPPQHIIEAAPLSSRRPMPVREIRRLFDDRLSAKSVKEHLAELQAFWEDRGMRLVELSDGWRFQTASELGPRFLRLDKEKPPRYSRAAMETLAIIAYHQPVTRGDIEELRGVTVNPATLRLFEERGWIETVGYRESPGRPALLATTRTFLNDLGLRSLAELPGPDAEPLPDFLLSEALPPSAAADEGPMPLQKEIDFEKQQ